MDLVASYDSDVEESQEINQNKQARVSIKCSEMSESSTTAGSQKYDVIDLDSDDSFETESENTKPSSDNTLSSSLKVTKEPDCIDLSEENDDDHRSISRCEPGIPNTSNDKSTKCTDYLKLEPDDSTEDDEPKDTAQDSLIALKNSAAVLSDEPCGPTKPSTVPVQSSSNIGGGTAGVVATNTPNKNLNPSEVSNQSSQINLTSNINVEKPPETSKETPNLFKENDKIIEAGQKNILCRIPRHMTQISLAHTKLIMSLNWCIPQYSHLFLSSSLDGYLKIWDVFQRNPSQVINIGQGLSAAKWSLDGGQIVTGGLGRKAYVYDVQTGKRIIEYDIYNFVTSMEVHPYVEDVFLVGTKNAILGFDVRVNTTFPVRSFFSSCQEVLDITFLDENEFVCSTNIVSHDSADRTIMVWDFSSGAILSNQIFLEHYTCPSLKVHPTDSSFVAQTNGNYIASFSTSRPYKMKNKRYSGHKVSGYSIECDISPDGKYLVSGDSEGGIFFYNYSTTSVVYQTVVNKGSDEIKIPTNKLKWHPTLPTTLVSSSYDGHIQVWK